MMKYLKNPNAVRAMIFSIISLLLCADGLGEWLDLCITFPLVYYWGLNDRSDREYNHPACKEQGCKLRGTLS